MNGMTSSTGLHRRRIALAMAVLTLLVQIVLALHEAQHLARAGHDHCEIAQIAHAFAAQLPSVSFQLFVPRSLQSPQFDALPANLQSEPRNGPPIHAPLLYG